MWIMWIIGVVSIMWIMWIIGVVIFVVFVISGKCGWSARLQAAASNAKDFGKSTVWSTII